jgi:hypothetical protein
MGKRTEKSSFGSFFLAFIALGIVALFSFSASWAAWGDWGGGGDEGYILSKNSDFSTFDTDYKKCDTLYVKVWSDRVDHNNLRNAYFEVKDFDGSQDRRVNLVNHHDGTFTGSTSLSSARSDRHELRVKIEDYRKRKYERIRDIDIRSGTCPSPSTTTTSTTTTTTQPGGPTTTTSSTTTTTLPPGQTAKIIVTTNRFVVLDDPNSGNAGP